ncbi:MAG: sulfurtransferase complex subunit TusB [Saccharospirillaceae bacterium]|nr:sulfurtransferase complex subunit TusB [Pseudomonadales bacterium]NRB79224.1 sulfurtransferase complex subunit TusB [Saccharospirillaceae bacterium]
MISTANHASDIPLESFETLHTLKGIFPDATVAQCIEQLTKNDVLLLMESGVNNLLIPEFLTTLTKIGLPVYALQDDTDARKINSESIKMISHLQFVDLSISSQRIINWF